MEAVTSSYQQKEKTKKKKPNIKTHSLLLLEKAGML